MKAVTLFPEHAEAFRLGIRSIETRPRRCNYRGRVALHAGMRDPDSAAARCDLISRAVMAAIPHGDPLPRGVVVASAVLTDCVPIVGEDGDLDRDSLDYACVEHRPADAYNAGLWLWPAEDEDEGEDMAEPADITRQLPFGDFSPGRWALLLDDIKPTTERCPYCWGENHSGNDKLSEVDAGAVAIGGGVLHAYTVCPVCNGTGKCDPVPARGQQAVPWEWTP